VCFELDDFQIIIAGHKVALNLWLTYAAKQEIGHRLRVHYDSNLIDISGYSFIYWLVISNVFNISHVTPKLSERLRSKICLKVVVYSPCFKHPE
jgi:hypothetical protein